MRRYQYNPRVLDVARTIPRGTVYDRRGLALATGEADVLGRARTDYAKFGIAIDAACAESARALLSARRRRLPRAWRRDQPRQLERTELVVCRARCRRAAARLRRPRHGRDRGQRTRGADDSPRLSRAAAAAAPPLRRRPSGGARRPRSIARRPPHHRCAAAGPRVRHSREVRVSIDDGQRGRDRPRHGHGPTAGGGELSVPNRRPPLGAGPATRMRRSSIARGTGCIRRAPRSSS